MPAKITLSKQEMDLVCNADIILTKNRIMAKAFDLLSQVQDDYTSGVLEKAEFLPEGIIERGAKISKGENYHGLPYLVLDFPRLFSREHTLAIRSMFWWGNFFSITLQLSGQFKTAYFGTIAAHYKSLVAAGFLIGVSDNPWEHHFDPTNYQKLSLDDFNEKTAGTEHLKIAARIPVEKWDDAEKWLTEKFNLLLNILSYRYDEKAP